MCGVLVFAARSTSTALKITHLPSGEDLGSPTRFSFIMSSKVKGCLAWAKAGRGEEKNEKKSKTAHDVPPQNKRVYQEVKSQKSDCRSENRQSAVRFHFFKSDF